jgi:hypothetical protein
MSPRRLCLFNTKTGASKRDLNFKTSILAVRLSRKRLATTSIYLGNISGAYEPLVHILSTTINLRSNVFPHLLCCPIYFAKNILHHFRSTPCTKGYVWEDVGSKMDGHDLIRASGASKSHVHLICQFLLWLILMFC